MQQNDNIRNKFLQDMELLGQAENMPPITGRLLGVLMFDGGKHSLTDLAKMLGVSRASICTSARKLEDYNLITRSREPNQRRDYFELTTSPYEKLMEIYLAQINASIEMMGETIKNLPEDAHDTQSRLSDFMNFYIAKSDATRAALSNMNGATDAATHKV